MLHLTGSTSFLHVFGFNDKISSIIVLSGTWRLFQGGDYRGHSVDMVPGRYKHVDDSVNNELTSLMPLPEESLDNVGDYETSADNEIVLSDSEVSEVTEELEQFRHQIELE